MIDTLKKLHQWFLNVGTIEKWQKIAAYEHFLTDLRAQVPDSLLLSGYGVFSQNDEDGIIQEIFHRIGTTNKHAVEIAVGNGLESNTHLLLQTGWQCTWFEATETNVSEIEQSFMSWLTSGTLKVVKSWVTASTIEHFLAEAKIPKNIDLLSLDIDGQEYWLWQALTKWKPRVLITEYNATLGPDVALTVPQNDTFAWDQRSIYCGASLAAFCILAKKKGYTLVCCNYTGVNAFFVRNDVLKKHFPVKTTEKLYQKPRIGGYVRPGYLRTVSNWITIDKQ